jgi:NADPH2:quinone reductase
MKAVVVDEFGPWADLTVQEVADPVPGRGEVLIEVAAAGINFPDILMVQGQYQVKPETPFIPGVEGAGTIVEIGDDVEGFAEGDRVVFLPDLGAFAEKVAVSSRRLIPMPTALTFEAGAGLAMIYGTSYHALKQRAKLQAGETLLVLGASGGVGTAAVQLGKAMGAKVIAAASTDEKLAYAAENGADHLIDYGAEDWRSELKAITAGRGVDVVYDPVGGPYSEPAFRSIAWKGRHLVVGFAAGDIPALPLNLALLKGASLVGVFWGAFVAREPAASAQNFAEIAELMAGGRLRPPISAAFPLNEVTEAFAVLAERRAVGKVILTI